jgi:5-methylcytosine-specific restriction endonuclease McrA
MNLNHESVLDKQICLSLNRNWVAIGCLSPKKAIIAMCGGVGDEHPALGMDIEMGVDENGNDVLISARPVAWEEWLSLPVRSCDFSVETKDRSIRAPVVLISANFSKIPMKRPRLSSRSIWERDRGICQYSGRQLTRAGSNIDHIHPRSRGGKDSWENCVLADKHLNSMKGDKFPHEVGLKLIRQPKAPPAVPVSASITEARHDFWKPFLIKNG